MVDMIRSLLVLRSSMRDNKTDAYEVERISEAGVK